MNSAACPSGGSGGHRKNRRAVGEVNQKLTSHSSTSRSSFARIACTYWGQLTPVIRILQPYLPRLGKQPAGLNQVFGRVYTEAWRIVGDMDRNAVTMPQDPQLLKRLQLFHGGLGQGGELL